QLALAVAGAQLQRPIRLRGGPVGDVGVLSGILVQHMQGLAVLADDLFLPGDQLVAEIELVPLVHERLGLGRAVASRQYYLPPIAAGGSAPPRFFGGLCRFCLAGDAATPIDGRLRSNLGRRLLAVPNRARFPHALPERLCAPRRLVRRELVPV